MGCRFPKAYCDGIAAHACRYAQAGTPTLKVETAYDAAARTYTISAAQSTPATPGQAQKDPVPIPLAVGLLRKDGSELPLTLQVGDRCQAHLVAPWLLFSKRNPVAACRPATAGRTQATPL